MRTPLMDRVAVVTGASTGIGRATALKLAHAGTRLALVARSKDKLESLADEVSEIARQRADAEVNGKDGVDPAALVAVADVADPDAVATMAERVRGTFPQVDILVNNAGIGHWSSFAETPPEKVRKIMEVNFFGALHCTRAFLPRMLERRSGTLVFVSSGLGELPFPNSSIYCASKHAMNGFAGSLRAEVEPAGVHVLLVMPGGTDSEFFKANEFPAPVLSEFLGQHLDSSEKVAERIVAGIRRGRRRVVLKLWNDLGLRLAKALPGLQARFLRRIGERLADGKET